MAFQLPTWPSKNDSITSLYLCCTGCSRSVAGSQIMNSLQLAVLLLAISLCIWCSKVACLQDSLSGTSSTPHSMAQPTSSQPTQTRHRNTTDSSNTRIGISPSATNELNGMTNSSQATSLIPLSIAQSIIPASQGNEFFSSDYINSSSTRFVTSTSVSESSVPPSIPAGQSMTVRFTSSLIRSSIQSTVSITKTSSFSGVHNFVSILSPSKTSISESTVILSSSAKPGTESMTRYILATPTLNHQSTIVAQFSSTPVFLTTSPSYVSTVSDVFATKYITPSTTSPVLPSTIHPNSSSASRQQSTNSQTHLKSASIIATTISSSITQQLMKASRRSLYTPVKLSSSPRLSTFHSIFSSSLIPAATTSTYYSSVELSLISPTYTQQFRSTANPTAISVNRSELPLTSEPSPTQKFISSAKRYIQPSKSAAYHQSILSAINPSMINSLSESGHTTKPGTLTLQSSATSISNALLQTNSLYSSKTVASISSISPSSVSSAESHQFKISSSLVTTVETNQFFFTSILTFVSQTRTSNALTPTPLVTGTTESTSEDTTQVPSTAIGTSLTLPPLDSSLVGVGGDGVAAIWCYSRAHMDDACSSQYGCYILRNSQTNSVVNTSCIERPDFEFCLRPTVVLDGLYAECCYDDFYCNYIDYPDPTRPSTPTATSPTATSRFCYKKGNFSNITMTTTCEAGRHGCFEIERSGDEGVRSIKMGCLKNTCKPIRKTRVIRQCCITSFCNDLHKRQSLFSLYQHPPLTLPPINSTFGGFISCYSPTDPHESCKSKHGCYTLRFRELGSDRVLNQTCIDRHDFEFCLVDPYPLLDGLYAVCCYEDYCNAPDPTAAATDAVTKGLNTSTSTEARSFTESAQSADTVYIIILVVVIVVAVIVSVAILTGFGVFAYCHSKRERLVRPPCMPRRVYPPPVGPDESQTVTMPVEMIH